MLIITFYAFIDLFRRCADNIVNPYYIYVFLLFFYSSVPNLSSIYLKPLKRYFTSRKMNVFLKWVIYVEEM